MNESVLVTRTAKEAMKLERGWTKDESEDREEGEKRWFATGGMGSLIVGREGGAEPNWRRHIDRPVRWHFIPTTIEMHGAKEAWRLFQLLPTHVCSSGTPASEQYLGRLRARQTDKRRGAQHA